MDKITGDYMLNPGEVYRFEVDLESMVAVIRKRDSDEKGAIITEMPITVPVRDICKDDILGLLPNGGTFEGRET